MADPLAPLIDRLHGEGRLRVWSLVITVFGDAIEPRGGEVHLARLQALLGRLGIEPGALRTALSRLAADGWVKRARQGRNALYRLSTRGQREFGPAAARIYAPPRIRPVGRWLLMMGEALPEGGLPWGTGPGGVPMRLFAADEAPRLPAGAFVIAGEIMRPGSGEGIGPEPGSVEMREALRLRQDMAALEGEIGRLDPLATTAARILLVHRFRRIVLRGPEWPDELLSPNSPLRGLRRDVAGLYHRLVPASEHWLDSEAPGRFPPLPSPGPSITARFGGTVAARQGKSASSDERRGD